VTPTAEKMSQKCPVQDYPVPQMIAFNYYKINMFMLPHGFNKLRASSNMHHAVRNVDLGPTP
jgi:hypothetical protein